MYSVKMICKLSYSRCMIFLWVICIRTFLTKSNDIDAFVLRGQLKSMNDERVTAKNMPSFSTPVITPSSQVDSFDTDDWDYPSVYINDDEIPYPPINDGEAQTFSELGERLLNIKNDDKHEHVRSLQMNNENIPVTSISPTITPSTRFTLLGFFVKNLLQPVKRTAQKVSSAILTLSSELNDLSSGKGQAQVNKEYDSLYPKKTLVIVYKYPHDIVTEEVDQNEKFTNSPPLDQSSPTDQASSTYKKNRFPPMERFNDFITGLVNSIKLDLLELGDVLLPKNTTNVLLPEEEILYGLGISNHYMDGHDNGHFDVLHDPVPGLDNNSLLQNIEKLQRRSVILRLLTKAFPVEKNEARRQLMVQQRPLASGLPPTYEGIRLDTNSLRSNMASSAEKTSIRAAPGTVTYTTPTYTNRKNSPTPSSSYLSRTTTIEGSTISIPITVPDSSNSSILNHQPAFKTTYLSNLHMESIDVTEEHADFFKKLLLEDSNVAAVYNDDFLDFSGMDSDVGEPKNRFDNSTIFHGQKPTSSSYFHKFQQRLPPSVAQHGVDTYFHKQWSLASPETFKGASNIINAWTLPIRKSQTTLTVALLDSGVKMDHVNLRNRFWVNEDEICDDGLDNDGNGFVDDCHGWNFIDNNNIPEDTSGHGTASAGILSAILNNGNGITPICSNCQIMNLKVLDSQAMGLISWFIKALNYALDKKVKISNNSFGGHERQRDILYEIVERAQKSGMIFVAPSGNKHKNVDNPSDRMYPACLELDNVISVAAVDKNGNVGRFSNWGETTVDLAAPGVNILVPAIKKGYRFVSGTSYAVPHVTGIVALIWSAFPELTYKEVIETVLTGTRSLKSLQGKTVTGGTLDAVNSLRNAAVIAKKKARQTLNECNTSYAPGTDETCENMNKCLSSVCPPTSICVNFSGIYDCRCQAGFAWNGLLSPSLSACRRIELPSTGPCSNNGGCGINSLCLQSNTLFAPPKVMCRCLRGYVKHPDGMFCVRKGLEKVSPDVYLFKIGQQHME